jgi:hypothetical protein
VAKAAVRSQNLVHNKSVDIATSVASERQCQTPDDRKAYGLPEPHSALVRADHKIELHHSITTRSGMSSECSHMARAMPRPVAAG